LNGTAFIASTTSGTNPIQFKVISATITGLYPSGTNTIVRPAITLFAAPTFIYATALKR